MECNGGEASESSISFRGPENLTCPINFTLVAQRYVELLLTYIFTVVLQRTCLERGIPFFQSLWDHIRSIFIRPLRTFYPSLVCDWVEASSPKQKEVLHGVFPCLGHSTDLTLMRNSMAYIYSLENVSISFRYICSPKETCFIRNHNKHFPTSKTQNVYITGCLFEASPA